MFTLRLLTRFRTALRRRHSTSTALIELTRDQYIPTRCLRNEERVYTTQKSMLDEQSWLKLNKSLDT